MEFSPDDPEWQNAFNQAFNDYLWHSALFFTFIGIGLVALTVGARHTKNTKLQKRLRLIRKLSIYVTVVGWVVFTGIILGIIPTGL
jgi:hypothetical protein